MQDKKHRIGLLDEIKGASLLLMILYHAAYDLCFIFDVPIPFFSSAVVNILRDFIAGTFIFIAGISSRFSRSNLRRGLYCLGFAMILTAATYLFVPDQLIVFGVLHLIGTCILLFALIHKLLDKLSPATGIGITAILFVLTRRVPYGYLGVPYLLEIKLPEPLSSTNYFSPLGFFNDTFFSSDYYPLLPWMFLFLCGAFAGVFLQKNRLPSRFYRSRFSFLSLAGRNTLFLYLIHQPILYGAFSLIFWLLRR